MNRTKCTFLLVIISAFSSIYASEPNTIKASLNGLDFTFDAQTGSILSLSYPGPGKMLEAKPADASIIDLAYPIEKFGALRFAPRFSKNVQIRKTDNKLILIWDRLGASRDIFEQSGNISATVTLKADSDGRSIIMTAQVKNDSNVPVRQVIFPDFSGLLPFAGSNTTMLRTGAFATTPFPELAMNEDRLSTQFCMDTAYGAANYTSGGMFSGMWLRWFDFGGLNGGLSLFPKKWGWDEREAVRLHRSQTEEKIRLLVVNDVEIKPGGNWKSGEYVLTPHTSGWAKGIEPYRLWVKQNVKRTSPVPKHVREGLGYRTIWMSQGFPDDPNDAVWKFSDFPKIAQENLDHGLTEMVLWGWNRGFELPLPKPNTNLGTEQDMINTITQCKIMGVNVAPFISVLQAGKYTAHKYGLTVSPQGWQQHVETIPAFQAPYLILYQCAQVPLSNELWQKEVLESCFHLIDSGMPSISWDQFWTTKEGYMTDLTAKIREHARKVDPQSTFSGEELWNVEIDIDYLDYTWNWGGYQDCQAYTSTFSSPRKSCLVSQSPRTVKFAFSDNLYLNVLPRKPNSVNGSDWIVNHSELSDALKQCAKLRKQFLPYFTDGLLIGNCILTEPCQNAHITAYALPDKVLMIVINDASDRKFDFKCNLEPWLKSESGKYTVKIYDNEGKLTETKEIDTAKWNGSTAKLNNLDIGLFEFLPINK